VSPGNGHVVICFGPNDVTDPPMPEILDYEQQIRPEVERRLGSRSALVNPFVATMFPNFSMLRATSRTFRVWHSAGARKNRGLVVDLHRQSGAATCQGSDPIGRHPGLQPGRHLRAGRHGQLAGVHAHLSRRVSRRSLLNTQMGLGHERFDDSLQGWASEFRMSESNHRQFYGRWAQLMTGRSWAEMSPAIIPAGASHA